MKHFINFLKGALVGVANIIPGVSGGTIAVITGIYENIIGIASNILKHLRSWKEFKKDLIYIIPIGIGAVIGILLLSKLIKFLLESYNMQTMYAFLGLIIGSIPLIFKKANEKKFNIKYLIPFAITLLIMIGLVVLNSQVNTTEVLQEFEKTPLEFLKVGIYGIIGAATMVIPGISGSMVMMIIGVYNAVINAVSALDIIILIPFAIGMVLGIVLISKLIKLLLEKWYGYTYYAILGFILGSIIFIYPGISFDITGIASIICFVIGAIISYKVGNLNKE